MKVLDNGTQFIQKYQLLFPMVDCVQGHHLFSQCFARSFNNQAELVFCSLWTLINIVCVDPPNMRTVQVLKTVCMIQSPFTLYIIGILVGLYLHFPPKISQ